MSDLSDLLDSLKGKEEVVKTVYDNLSWMWKPRETVVATPRAGWPEGTNEANTNTTIDRAADVIKAGTGFYSQLKGLFGLGYPATEPQPTSPVQHEVKPAAAVAGMSAGTIAVIAVLLLLIFK